MNQDDQQNTKPMGAVGTEPLMRLTVREFNRLTETAELVRALTINLGRGTVFPGAGLGPWLDVNAGGPKVDADGGGIRPPVIRDFFPRGRTGDVSGTNDLFRMNWFNGRFLTAEALRRQDVYWDQRALQLAHVHPPGIAWGLGLEVADETLPPLGATRPTTGNVGSVIAPQHCGFKSDESIELQPGLAFDGMGRPIVVCKPLRFSLNDLVTKYRAKPRVVTGGGTQFMPCICLEPESRESAVDPGPSLRPGPYLLVIEPEEFPQGEAKVYGEVCSGPEPVYCEADGWRGGFGLSLVRFPTDVSTDDDIRTAWDLRGTLAAYYFDVWEHDLRSRWDPDFAENTDFCAGTGPYLHPACSVPLAMVYVGVGNCVMFVDPWIPRRSLASTTPAAWSATLIGAPSPAAAVARIHQFQCQLAESLKVRPLLETVEKPGPSTTVTGRVAQVLHQTSTSEPPRVNFNHFDFSLPPEVKVGRIMKIYRDDVYIVQVRVTHVQSGRVSSVVIPNTWREEDLMVKVDDRAEFEVPGETTTEEVSLNLYQRGFRHIPPVGFLPIEPGRLDKDFDQLETDGSLTARLLDDVKKHARAYFEGTNVFPYYFVVALHDDDVFEDIQNVFNKDPIALRLRKKPKISALIKLISKDDVQGIAASTNPLSKFLLGLYLLWAYWGLTLNGLVNREIEIVKIMIPLQGLRRKHPIVDGERDDARKPFDAWFQRELPGDARAFGSLPRHFVVYVKQRIVIAEFLYGLLDVLGRPEHQFIRRLATLGK